MTSEECDHAVHAVAYAMASLDGKLDDYRAGQLAASIVEEPGGHFSGYQADAQALIERIRERGFAFVKIRPI